MSSRFGLTVENVSDIDKQVSQLFFVGFYCLLQFMHVKQWQAIQ